MPIDNVIFLILSKIAYTKFSEGPPNKVDRFDTRVSETIDLFLFAKTPVAQGFSDPRLFGLVSLWAEIGCFHDAGLPFLHHFQAQ